MGRETEAGWCSVWVSMRRTVDGGEGEGRGGEGGGMEEGKLSFPEVERRSISSFTFPR